VKCIVCSCVDAGFVSCALKSRSIGTKIQRGSLFQLFGFRGWMTDCKGVCSLQFYLLPLSLGEKLFFFVGDFSFFDARVRLLISAINAC